MGLILSRLYCICVVCNSKIYYDKYICGFCEQYCCSQKCHYIHTEQTQYKRDKIRPI